MAADETSLGLMVGGPPLMHPFDELNGLDLMAEIINEPTAYFKPGQFFFSLKSGSPSLGATAPN